MFIKKQQILSIVIFISLLFGTIVITPINAFAESPDYATNTQVEDTDGNPDEIQEEDPDGSSDDIQEQDPDGSSDNIQEQDPDGSFDNIQEEDNTEAPDEVQGEDADGSSDEISDADVDEEIVADFLDENTDIISEKAINKVIKSNAKQTSGLSITVEYPEQLQCKTPITFTVNADGGSGDYQYRVHSIMTSELAPVYDVSWGSNSAYQDSNTFSFTFHASGIYYVRFSVLDKGVTPYQTANTGLYEYKLVIQDPQYPSVEQIVENTVAECMKSCTTDFEKAVWLHDWILNHADYDYSYSYCSAEGVLARGLGTCESYHKAYVMLLNKAGIATGRIEGNGHVWTAVRMDGQWYQVDSTWDDMGEKYKGTYYEHMYFGLTDNIMGLVHSDHTSATPGYESTSLENNYFIKTGMITQWSDPFVELVNQNIANGKTEFSLPVTDSMPNNYKNVIYNLVAYQLSNQSWGNMEVSASYKDSVITITVQEEKKLDNVYNGIDYSAVYDYTYYISKYPDLKKAFGDDKHKALEHFVNAGMSEGRQGKDSFNVYTYMNRYADLKNTYGNNLKKYYLHYISTGIKEGRDGSGEIGEIGGSDPTPPTSSAAIYNGVDYSAVYDYNYYLTKYPDLKSAFKNNEKAALQHFVNAGMSEGRQGKGSFNVYTYMNRYKDLKNAFGNNLKRYYMHYISAGIKEGRDGSEEIGDSAPTPPTGSATTYNGVDYSAVYDYNYYLAKYPDLKSAFKNNENAALQHFVNAGMSEGRQGKDSFNVYTYMNRYADLRNAFGNNLKNYYLHYMNNGLKEGRSGS